MTVKQLHELTRKVIAGTEGDMDVAINFSTFAENENGNILLVTSAEVIRVQGTDDSGPIGDKELFFVLDGGHREVPPMTDDADNPCHK